MSLLVIVRIRRTERLTHLYITALRSQLKNNNIENNDNQLITLYVMRLYACAGSYHGRRARPAASHTTLGLVHRLMACERDRWPVTDKHLGDLHTAACERQGRQQPKLHRCTETRSVYILGTAKWLSAERLNFLRFSWNANTVSCVKPN